MVVSLSAVALHLDVSPAIAGLLPGVTWQEGTVWQTWFQQWLSHEIIHLPGASGYELSLQLGNDEILQKLNACYRQVDAPTDVLAFAALENATPIPPEILATEPLYLGDIAISVETAARQADDSGHSLESELVWLASHGLLHLLDWDHPNRERLRDMLQCQAYLLQISNHTPPNWQRDLSKY